LSTTQDGLHKRFIVAITEMAMRKEYIIFLIYKVEAD